jgi:nucleotide-binding universal stress UspA family protein/N-acetylglutamate synthase-like GNAT family acetyltransferase
MADYDRVLIPTDFSPWAAASVERCPEIPGVREVVLLHVTTPRELHASHTSGGNNDLELSRIRQHLENDGKFLEEQGLHVTIEVEPSHGPVIARTILQAADRTGATLILIGARGAGRVREALLGSVSHDVIRHAKQHILVMHPRSYNNSQPRNATACPLLFSKALCPLDLSRVSEETIRSTQGLNHRSHLILFHAISQADSVAQLNLIRKRATDRLDELRSEIVAQGGSAEINVRMGNPVLLSCTDAEREDVSLILLSRYGRFDYMKNIPIGATTEAIAMHSTRPVLIRNTKIPLELIVRELSHEEFSLAEQVWEQYHRQKADRSADRIFAIFIEGTVAGVARCKRHPDGVEVDGVFVGNEFRDRGYARRLMQELVRQRGHDVLYMHSTLELVSFYKSFGFIPIGESELPPTIRERFNFALGNMQGSDVCPMRRTPP